MNEALKYSLIIIAIFAALGVAVVIATHVHTRRQAKRKADKRRIAEIERQWRKMDEQPREKSGRYTFKRRAASK